MRQGDKFDAQSHRDILRSVGGLRGDALDAQLLVDMTVSSEADQLKSGVRYSPEEVALATVHTRQDILLVVRHLSVVARRLKWTNRFLVFLAVVLSVCATKFLLQR